MRKEDPGTMKETISTNLTKKDKARLLHQIKQIRGISDTEDHQRTLDEFRIVSACTEACLIGEQNPLFKALCYFELACELKKIEDDLTPRDERYKETLGYLDRARQQDDIPPQLKSVILNYMAILTIARGETAAGITLLYMAQEEIARQQDANPHLVRAIDLNILLAKKQQDGSTNYYYLPEMKVSKREIAKS